MAEVSERLQRQIGALGGLRATGPLSTDYARWVDETLVLLVTLFGESSLEVRRFKAAVGERGRDDGFGLPLEGEWGIWARMQRSEGLLKELQHSIERGSA